MERIYHDMVRQTARETSPRRRPRIRRQRKERAEETEETENEGISDGQEGISEGKAVSEGPKGASEGLSDSDLSDDFEDVLPPDETPVTLPEPNPSESFNISINAPKPPKPRKFNPITKDEREKRRLIHQMYLVLMAAHCMVRNQWLNDPRLHETREWVPQKVRDLFFTEKAIGAVKARRFLDGLKAVLQSYSKRFKTSGDGLVRKEWGELGVVQKNAERLTKNRLVERILARRGSRDVAAQGLVACLRALGLNARLVCSFQPPDYTRIKELKELKEDKEKEEDGKVMSSRTLFINKKPPKTHSFPSIPFFWAEVFNPHSRKWHSVDCSLVQTIETCPMRRKSAFEQALKGHVYYVMAFDRWGGARDVTRRYTQSYNSKVVKKRIAHRSDEDEEWYERLISGINRRKTIKSFDIAELKEFRDRDLAEGMPNNVQDFKNHPIYALESQLHKNEVIHPHDKSSQCGTFRVKKQDKTIPVYKRSCVYQLRSAKAWYMRGRVLKVGAQALKVVRKNDDEETRLYAEFQTCMYVAPAIVDGAIPKNAYGNIDLYTRTMLPDNGAYIEHDNVRMLEKAAQLAGVDYARAVVAFDFSKKARTVSRMPKVKEGGIVVSKEHEEGIRAIFDGLMEEEEENVRMLWRINSLKNWKYFLAKLRIQKRLNRQFGDLKKGSENENEDESENESEGINGMGGLNGMNEGAKGIAKGMNEGKRNRKGKVMESDLSDSSDFSDFSEGPKKRKLMGSDSDEYDPNEDTYVPRSTRAARAERRRNPNEESGFIKHNGVDEERGFINHNGVDEGSGGFINGHNGISEDGSGGFINDGIGNGFSGGFINDGIGNGFSGGFINEDGDGADSFGGGFITEDIGGFSNGNMGGFSNGDTGGFSNGEIGVHRRGSFGDSGNAGSGASSEDIPDDLFEMDEDGNLVYAPEKKDSMEGKIPEGEKDYPMVPEGGNDDVIEVPESGNDIIEVPESENDDIIEVPESENDDIIEVPAGENDSIEVKAGEKDESVGKGEERDSIDKDILGSRSISGELHASTSSSIGIRDPVSGSKNEVSEDETTDTKPIEIENDSKGKDSISEKKKPSREKDSIPEGNDLFEEKDSIKKDPFSESKKDPINEPIGKDPIYDSIKKDPFSESKKKDPEPIGKEPTYESNDPEDPISDPRPPIGFPNAEGVADAGTSFPIRQPEPSGDSSGLSSTEEERLAEEEKEFDFQYESE